MPSRLLFSVVFLAAVAGCASRRVSIRPDVSGFLDDYSLLHRGAPGEVALVYRNPDADWKSYDKVLLEPVTLWRSGRKSLDPLPEEDMLRLVDGLEGAMRQRLGQDFRLVDEPGPGVMRIRLAITEARASDPILDVLRAHGGAAKAGTDGPLHPETRRFIEAAEVEGEIRDAATNQLLAAGVDRPRQGALSLDTWAHVARAADSWVDCVCSRLEARTRKRGIL